ncbi:unnamed protein product [Symbiodinium microadriaticum]|nr:unnamed protein product [Symbiodinium microadriaticum]CAE7583421.1 unnamed protein product [Symbiodinium sp. KB8]
MKFLRQLAAGHNGRLTNGSTEVVLDLRGTFKPDPSALLVEQHLRSYIALVLRWPEDLEPVLVNVFQGMQERFLNHREPWRIAAGPLGATLCYAKDMGWTALSLTQSRIEGKLWCLEDPVQLEQVVQRTHHHWAAKRRGSIGDPRCWRMTWAAIAFVCKDGNIEVLATATGPVPGDQTVFRAEAMALLFIAEHTAGDVDITIDAKSVKTRVERRSLGKTSLDLFIPLREHSDRLHLSWIRSHRSLAQHVQEFGADTAWRWSANGVVDKLAGDEANGARDLSFEAQLQATDKATQKVQGFLAERVALLFGYDKDQGPQVTFDGETAPASKQELQRATGPGAKKVPRTEAKERQELQVVRLAMGTPGQLKWRRAEAKKAGVTRPGGQYFRWSKSTPPAPVGKAVPPAPPPPRRRRTPDEPSAPPKAKGTAVKSKAKIVGISPGGSSKGCACSARYLMAASVEDSSTAMAKAAGSMVKTDLQVLGLGGSRIVVRSPSNPTLVWKISKEEQETERKLFRLMGRWTPGRVRALGAHRVQEVGPQGSVFYASVLEMELCAECPRFCVQTAFELLLTIVHTAKFVLVRDVGRKNVGSRPSGGDRMGEPARNLLILLDGNYWEAYGRSHPHWPGKQKAQGLWSSLNSFTPKLLLPFQEITQRHSGDLESLFLAGHKLMEEMLPEAEFSEACENLLETQVMGQTPDGQLGQWILRDAVVHSLEGGHQWTLVPLMSPSKSRLKARSSASRA